jgi:hypothetical protein
MRIAAVGLTLVALPALGADAPDMIGKWTGTSRAVVVGSGGHYGAGDVSPQFRSAELTIEWTDQDDGRLIGTITSSGATEPKIAVLSTDGETLVTADSDGTSVGRIIDPDHFELCYTQSSAGDDQMVASCVTFARVE